ncbi:hypothetical protein [Streptomyces sp. NPDC101234]
MSGHLVIFDALLSRIVHARFRVKDKHALSVADKSNHPTLQRQLK